MRPNPATPSRVTLAVAALAIPLAFTACADLEGDATSEDLALTSTDLTRVYPNGSGSHQTISTTGNVNVSNPFFLSLGTNGRACVSCHQPAAAWGITPVRFSRSSTRATARIRSSDLNDGSNAPNLPVTTVAQRRTAYSLLLNRGVIRVGLPIPANAEFDLVHGRRSVPLRERRRALPVPSAAAVDEPQVPGDGHVGRPRDRRGRADRRRSGDPVQRRDPRARPGRGRSDGGAAPGDRRLRDRAVHGADHRHARREPDGRWRDGRPRGPVQPAVPHRHQRRARRRPGRHAVLYPRVQHLRRVGRPDGLDAGGGPRLDRARPGHLQHPAVHHLGRSRRQRRARHPEPDRDLHHLPRRPNAGNHSVGLPLDLGLTDPNTFNTDTTPRYTLRNKTTGEIIRTSDPGRSLIDGKWGHVATFKGPILRGLAARPPYFHNGFAASLPDVVKFYDTRFHIGLDAQAAADLAAFLSAT